RQTDLSAECAYRLLVARPQARQPVEPIPARRRVGQDPRKRVRRHAEASRHTDAFDPRKLPQERAFAAHDRNLGLVDLREIQHVAHTLTSRGVHPVTPLLSVDCSLRWAIMGHKSRPHESLRSGINWRWRGRGVATIMV